MVVHVLIEAPHQVLFREPEFNHLVNYLIVYSHVVVLEVDLRPPPLVPD